MSLNAYLRYVLCLPGTKAMCREGGCGACIVSVKAVRPINDEVETFSVNSCLVLVFSCHGWDITTIEAEGNRRDGYSDVQKRIAAFNGTQCGYCTPGWIMQMHSLKDKHLTMAELEKSFGSNTCRCTGYRPILDTMKSFAVDASPKLCQKLKDIEDLKICKSKNKCQSKCSISKTDSDWSLISDHGCSTSAVIELDFHASKYCKVFEEDQIFEILNRQGYDSYLLVDGNTAKGVFESFAYPRVLIDISSVRSLKHYDIDQNLVLGANVSLQDTLKICADTAKSHNEFAFLAEFAEHFEKIAHLPVRMIGSLAGNLMLKHLMPAYQSDVFLLLDCVGAMLTVRHANNQRKSFTMSEFLSYDMQGVLILNIEIPPLSRKHVIRTYKIMPRNQNALAIVNAAFLVKLATKTDKVEEVSIVFGNISSTFSHAISTEGYLKGKNPFSNATIQGALKVLEKELIVKDDPPESSPECRKKLALGLFYKWILSIAPAGIPSASFLSGAGLIQRPVSHGTQDFQTDASLFPLNQPVSKLEAIIQSAGEAQYANDTPNMPGQVFAAFVLSTVHSGQVDYIDEHELLSIDGVLAIYTAKDIPGKNSFTMPGFQLQTEEEEIVASKDIKFYGQPIAIVVATSEELAAQAARYVKVIYRNVTTMDPILTIDQAKKDSKRLIPSDAAISSTAKGTNVKKVLKGVYEIHAQYHYYMEPITCVVAPVDESLEIYDSSQWMDLSQIVVALCLGIKESDVNIKVRRIGGGFGGKISRNVQATAACALVAHKLNAPCRFVLPMQTNMAIAGRRLPCQTEYEVGVDDDGLIQYLKASIVEDMGCSENENILSYVVGGFPNCYDPTRWDVSTALAITDLASNTFARAPGTHEGQATIEHIMENIAFAVQKDPTEVRLTNMRKDDNDLPQLIELLKKDADYDNRHNHIKQFNQANRWMKKAIAISVMSFPVEFYGNYHAMVTIYRGDGTVTVTTGGVEMGQGINTKAAQVCAYCLGIPLESVSVLPNYSFVAANNVFSGSSITSESVCYSTIKACDILKKRLEPIKAKMTEPSWKELVKQAGDDEVDLQASYMMTDKEEDLSSYSAFAVTILEVQLDVLTGRYEILRVDILEDVGLSANPNIDVGQVEGGYIQGIGYFTSEKMVFDKQSGRLLTNRSLLYHVPLCTDIPADFRVKLRYNEKNPKGVLGSKAVGEMGICTAHGITHALRSCITESRKESGYDPNTWISIDIPYDTESILKALAVKPEELLIAKK